MKHRVVKNRLSRNKLPPKKLRGKNQLGIRKGTPRFAQQNFLERIKNHRSTKLLGVLITFFLTLFALSEPISDAFLGPEIQHSIAQVDDPFSVRFSLHNPSSILPMTDVRINCVMERIQLENNLSLVGIPIDDGVVASIPPGDTIEYECPVYKAFDEIGPIVRAKIKINATFNTLGIERTTESELFSWDIISRQWIKGEIVN